MTKINDRLPPSGGAYILHLHSAKDLSLKAGSLGDILLPAGRYVYVGSARRSIESRVARHRRLASSSSGKIHWHIDYVLTHPEIDLVRVTEYPGGHECEIALGIAEKAGTSVPVPGFGATDCRSGCAAHFFRIGDAGTVRKGKSKTELPRYESL